jgi:hypothetical protein
MRTQAEARATTDTAVDAYLMVSVAVRELTLLLESPPYVARNMTWPIVAPVTLTGHVPLARVHVAELRETDPVLIWDHVPVGE